MPNDNISDMKGDSTENASRQQRSRTARRLLNVWLTATVVFTQLLLVVSVTAVVATIFGCATTARSDQSLRDDGARKWLQRLFPESKLPASARNVHAYSESYPVGEYLIARFDAKTADLEQSLEGSFWLAWPRTLTENEEDKKMFPPPYPADCPWWTPLQATRFGSVSIIREYRDKLPGEARFRKFYYATCTKVGLADIGNGRSVIFIQVSVNEPEKERE